MGCNGSKHLSARQSQFFPIVQSIREEVTMGARIKSTRNRDINILKLLDKMRKLAKNMKNLDPKICNELLLILDLMDKSYSAETITAFKTVLAFIDERSKKLPMSQNRLSQPKNLSMLSSSMDELSSSERAIRLYSPVPTSQKILGHYTISAETKDCSLASDDDFGYGFYEEFE